MSFVLLTDSSADLSAEMVRELDIQVLPLTFTLNETNYCNYPDNRDMDPHLFYEKLRAGEVATTAAVNMAQYTEMLEPLLQAGQDVLVLAFSSGLSATFQSSRLAVEELLATYPGRRLYTVDTLCASMGQGLLVYLAARKRQEGASIEEVRDWAEQNRLNQCHWFTVNDLFFLKKGGRVSAATAVVGTMLQIKPVMHVDNEGHLIKVDTARGRKASLNALVDKVGELADNPAAQTMFISNSDCQEDAQYVADQIKARYGTEEIIINSIGPVIGAHTGPGCVALFFTGKHR